LLLLPLKIPLFYVRAQYPNKVLVKVALIKIKAIKAVYNDTATRISLAIHDGDFYFYQPLAVHQDIF
jgi:hypothetical protein